VRDAASGRQYVCEAAGIPCSLQRRLEAWYRQHNERLYAMEPQLPRFPDGCCDEAISYGHVPDHHVYGAQR